MAAGRLSETLVVVGQCRRETEMTSNAKTVVWATDGSKAAESALAAVRRFLPEIRVIAVHCDQRVSGRGGVYSLFADEDDLRAFIEAKVEELKDEGLDIVLVVRSGHASPADAVSAVASRRDADCIVCGTRGCGALRGAFLGRVAQRLLQIAPCPVIAVPLRVGATIDRYREEAVGA
jgi:nucleotide-binding universal stress UspA family protein